MSSFQNPGRRGQYWVSAVDYGPNLEPGFGGYGSDRSNKTDDIIYIGDLFNSSVVAYKGFLEDIQYDVSKDGETEDKQETGVAIYNSYSGKIGIKLSFNVPSHTRNEAKNSLAKIEHLQKSIFQARNDSEGTAYYKKFKRSIQFVYLSNLINNGNLKASRAISNFTQLRSIGLPCNITEVSYKPDFTAGFHELGGRIYPKNYKLNLTLDPVTNVQVNGKFFLFPFLLDFLFC